jgi:hypothetical protein
MRFRSKVDTWFKVVLCVGPPAVIVAAIAGAADDKGPPLWLLSIILALVIVLPAWLLVATHYTFLERELLVQSGPFRWRIPFSEIRSVARSRNPLSSPALSLDRLRIDYGQSRWLLVSPADQKGFLKELEKRANVSPANTLER